MTPKEKAIKLVDIYKDITTTWIFNGIETTNVINYDLAKQCALIAVNELIEFAYNYTDYNEKSTKEYLEKVKQEIEKL